MKLPRIRRRPSRRPIKDPYLEGRQFNRRAVIGFGLVAAVTLALLLRYAWLQVASFEEFETRSVNNRVRVVPVVPNRGLIYDRRGRAMAENRPAYRLELVPEKISDLNGTIRSLAGIVDLPDNAIDRFRRNMRHHRSFDSVPLKFNLSEEEVARFAVNRHRYPAAEIVPYLSRYYPYGEIMTHVLGYVGRMDEADLARVDSGNYRGTTHIGKNGIERYYEMQLHGRSGVERVETNAQGRILRVLEREPPEHGDDLVLSIDLEVQQVAWDALGDRPGAVVAIDPQDGSVIAMVSKPAFDPNAFVHGISTTDYQAIVSSPGRPLFNRAVWGGYEPGSTLKPFIGLGGLELGIVDAETKIWSGGQFRLPNHDRPYRDWKAGGHGWVTIEQALEESVNSYFYQLALDMGIDRMHAWLEPFGFGAPTGIDMPGEASGVLPSRDWKRGQYGQPWYPGETVIAGIGQGFNVVTPIQLATALAALANGGTVFIPHLLQASKPGGGAAELTESEVARRIAVTDQDNWLVIRSGMERVVHGAAGTARAIEPLDSYRIAGKSGTAQVVAQAEDQGEPTSQARHLQNHALFAAYAPATRPLIAVAAVVEHGGGGSAEAAPVARLVIDAWLRQEMHIASLNGAGR